MKKLLVIPVSIAFLFLFSCSDDGCECTKRTYNYDGDPPTSETKVVDCPGDMEDGEYIYEMREDGRIDYVIHKTCI